MTDKSPLDNFFRPRSVAIVGASPQRGMRAQHAS